MWWNKSFTTIEHLRSSTLQLDPVVKVYIQHWALKFFHISPNNLMQRRYLGGGFGNRLRLLVLLRDQ